VSRSVSGESGGADRITSRTRSSLVNATLAIAGSCPGRQQNNLSLPQVAPTPLPADDPHQSLAHVIVDLADSQAIYHRPSRARGSVPSSRMPG
jgi:hypothetical protein